jgi:hypothetical protein
MNKLSLNLDDLQVDSFAAQDDATSDHGTVRGQADDASKRIFPCNDTQDLIACGTNSDNATICIASCGGTCIENTCGLETIYDCFEI